jgi:hypothetical protein
MEAFLTKKKAPKPVVDSKSDELFNLSIKTNFCANKVGVKGSDKVV